MNVPNHTSTAPQAFRVLLANAVRRHPERPALRYELAGEWNVLCWHEVGALVVEAARWLDTMPDVHRIAVVGPASIGSWILKAGALVTGVDINLVYEDALPDEQAAALAATQPDLIAVGGGHIESRADADKGIEVVSIELALEEWRLHQTAAPRPTAGKLAAWIHRWGSADAAVLLQSTGTTGPPTVIELGDGAMTAATWSLRDEVAHEHPRFLAFLPAAHTSHLLINFYAATMFAADVWIGAGVDTITDDLAACRPTVMFGAPLLFHAIREEFQSEAGSNPIGRFVYRRLEKRAHEIESQGRIGRRSASLLGKLVGRFIARSAGLAEAKEIFSGTSPLDAETHAFFAALGWYVRNTYGLTECGGAATVSGRESMQVGELGHVVEGLDLRFAEDGEILLRGPALMRGKLGRGALASGEWLMTGDLGHRDGSTIRFVGRKADRLEASSDITSLVDLDRRAQTLIGSGQCVSGRLPDGTLALVVAAAEDGSAPPTAAQTVHLLSGSAVAELVDHVLVDPEPLTRERGELGATGKVRRWKALERLGAPSAELARDH